MIRQVKLLRAGQCSVEASILLNRDGDGALMTVPVWVYLVYGDDGLFLIDTGMPPECVNNPRYFDGTEDEGKIIPIMQESDTIDCILSKQGLQLSDIDGVVSTHWHFDHAGGNRIMRNRPILVHPAEVEAAKQGAFMAECKDLTIPYHYVEDGAHPTPGMTLLHTPGHTAGNLSVLLEVSDGAPILLTCDAVYTSENWTENRPGAMADYSAGQGSMDRLKKIAEATDARVFFGHDRQQSNEPDWQRMIH